MAKRLRLTTPMAVVTAVEEVAAVDLEAALLVVGAAAEDSVEDAEEEVMDLTEVSEVAEEVDVEASEVVIERVAVEVSEVVIEKVDVAAAVAMAVVVEIVEVVIQIIITKMMVINNNNQ